MAVGEAEYVIIGAGSAGCVLADRLSADGGSRVILVEAGDTDRSAAVTIPAAYPKAFGTSLDWDFSTTPQTGLAGRSVRWPRGRTLGGSSSINAQIWTRGHRADYDGWAAAGCAGWSFADVLPFFLKAENRICEDGPGGFGGSGPVRVEDLRELNPATAAFLQACAQAGHPALGRSEVSEPTGHGPVRVTQNQGRRWSAADAYLRPALQRPNLTVLTGAQVHRVVVEAGRATGVEVQTATGVTMVSASREVILAAGAVSSPQLLMLSGIGAPDALKRHGIAVQAAHREVGANLADHLYVPLSMTAKAPVSPGVGEQAANTAAYLRGRRGPLSSNLAEALAFLHTEAGLEGPDIELLWMVVADLAGNSGPAEHGLTVGVVLLQPASRGTITLACADPSAHPVIDAGYLTDAASGDVATLTAGVRLAQRVLGQPALAPWVSRPFVSGALDQSPESISSFTRDHAQTLFHPVGTCRMGADADAVVDLEFRVRGIAGLRVVDASVMPRIPRGHTQAPTVMLAERAAELISAVAHSEGALSATAYL